MYNITRQDAADMLKISTRSIDRYIKSWKLRAKKEGKIIYIHNSDIESLSGESSGKQEVIIPTLKKQVENFMTSSPAPKENSGTLEKIYADLRSEIQKKDSLIQDLSLQLWQSQEIAKNSISLVEFKKSQFLLEESRGYLGKEVAQLKEKKEEIEKQLQYEKSTNYLLIGFIVVLFVTLWLVWFIKI